jgi:hypothetical protein
MVDNFEQEARTLTRQRRCFACLADIPNAPAVYRADLRNLLCRNGVCSVLADQFDNDYSHSQRGKRRPPLEVLLLIREAPPCSR